MCSLLKQSYLDDGTIRGGGGGGGGGGAVLEDLKPYVYYVHHSSCGGQLGLHLAKNGLAILELDVFHQVQL